MVKVFSSGGRVLCATALGENISIAQTKAYKLVKESIGMVLIIEMILDVKLLKGYILFKY